MKIGENVTVGKVKRLLSKVGLSETIKLLSSEDFSEEVKAELEKLKIVNNGIVSISVLMALQKSLQLQTISSTASL